MTQHSSPIPPITRDGDYLVARLYVSDWSALEFAMRLADDLKAIPSLYDVLAAALQTFLVLPRRYVRRRKRGAKRRSTSSPKSSASTSGGNANHGPHPDDHGDGHENPQ